MKKLTLNSNAFNKGEVLTRAQLKKVMGGSGSGDGNPNCGETNPVGDYSCCLPDSIAHVSDEEVDCETASEICAGWGGSMITTDPSRCN